MATAAVAPKAVTTSPTGLAVWPCLETARYGFVLGGKGSLSGLVEDASAPELGVQAGGGSILGFRTKVTAKPKKYLLSFVVFLHWR